MVNRDSKESYSFREACDALSLPPQVLRRVLKDYKDVLDYQESESEASSRYLPVDAVENIRAIMAYEAAGMDKGQITERLALKRASAGHSVEPPGAYEMLLSRIEVLEKQLAESEKRRIEDRDKLFTALARTQQELQRLKNDIEIASSRRNRNPSLIRRFLAE